MDPASTGHRPCAGAMLGQRRRRWPTLGQLHRQWPNIEPTLGQCLVFAGRCIHVCTLYNVTGHTQTVKIPLVDEQATIR